MLFTHVRIKRIERCGFKHLEIPPLRCFFFWQERVNLTVPQTPPAGLSDGRGPGNMLGEGGGGRMKGVSCIKMHGTLPSIQQLLFNLVISPILKLY